MDYHLLFYTPTPSPTPTPTMPSLESIVYEYMYSYQMAVMWWGIRMVSYYVLTQGFVFYVLPVFLRAFRLYIESFFPPPLVGVAHAVGAVAGEAVSDMMEDVGDAVEGLVDDVGDTLADSVEKLRDMVTAPEETKAE